MSEYGRTPLAVALKRLSARYCPAHGAKSPRQSLFRFEGAASGARQRAATFPSCLACGLCSEELAHLPGMSASHKLTDKSGANNQARRAAMGPTAEMTGQATKQSSERCAEIKH